MVELKHGVFGAVGQPTELQEKSAEQPSKMNQIDLMSLIELGCVKEEVNINGMVFVVKSLNAAERLMLSDVVEGATDVSQLGHKQLFEFNITTLAMSIETVGGVSIDKLVGDKMDDTFAAKKQVISNLQNSVIAALLNAYTTATNRADAQFTPDQIKN